jgi:Rrf2 family nitric oxide-sensitive transcriptional repressor
MQLTTYTDYALRVLIYLAVYDDRLVTIADITNAYGISKNHLMKIVHHLAQRGWITTTRGRRGGVRLAHPPTDISLGTVVQETEPHFHLVLSWRRFIRRIHTRGYASTLWKIPRRPSSLPTARA